MDSQLNKEQIHDTQISPLMAQIIDICKANKIAFVASFAIPTDEEPELACSSAILTDECNPPAQLLDAWRAIRSSRTGTLMLRTQRADGSTTLTAIVG